MPAMKDQAISLRRLDYSETSQVLLFFTREHGTRRLIAKGIKRSTKTRFSPGIDLLERGEVVFAFKAGGDSTLGTLMEWRQIDLHLGLRQDLRRLYSAQYAGEISAAMVEEADPHPALFDALAGLLRALADGGDPLPLLVSYQAAALKTAGLWPDLSRCVLCGKEAPAGRAAWFSAHQGGLVCRNCAPRSSDRIKVSAAPLDALRQARFTPDTVRGGFDLLDHALSHAIGARPDLSRYIQTAGR